MDNKRYNNYHKHDDQGNVRMIDVMVKSEDYMKRAKELGHTTFFSTNHGVSANIFESYDLCKKYDLKCIHGMECYFAYDRFERGGSNYHLIIISLNHDGYKKLNLINSIANIDSFYKQPRIGMDLLLSLNPDNFIVTTACINNPLFFKDERYDEINDFLLPLKNHFKNNFFIEVQAHNDEKQIQFNSLASALSDKYDIPLMHANDSHYIHPNDKKNRSEFLKGKGFDYSFEDEFILDYPDYETIIERYMKQGILTVNQINRCIYNTLVYDKAKDLGFTKDIKMPTIHKELSLAERYNKLENIIVNEFAKYKETVTNKGDLQRRMKGIVDELKVIKETNKEIHTADYFLLNKPIVDKAINEYGGKLTKTGRGSGVSFFLNKLLGFTEIDRFETDVKLYPSRFISSARLLDSRSMPDLDLNMADDKPFIQASKDILGEHGVYKMLAYGTMQESSAFRNLCRARGFEMNDYNHVAKDLELYTNDIKWKALIEESKKYINTIESVVPSPCSFVMLNEDIREEIGVMRINNEICACIDGYTSDVWKFLKNDFLIVTVWDIIYKVFNIIGKSIPTIRELNELLDDKVWGLYEKGLTCTLNQADSDFATSIVKKYKPTSPAEMCAFVAILRPACNSFRDEFVSREEYTTGTTELDEILKDSFHRLIYQENLMSYFSWLGIPEDETYDLIKMIAKKKFEEDEIGKLEERLHKEWVNKIGNDDSFYDTWQIVIDSAKYLFNASHSLSVAYDSLYGAYLKANYPIEYYSVALDTYKDDMERTNKLIKELDYFNITIENIKFGKSTSNYVFDKENSIIYKSISSIKFCNSAIAEELNLVYNTPENQYAIKNKDFIFILNKIKRNTSSDWRHIKILTSLGYFSEFAKNKKLLNAIYLYEKLDGRKQISESNINEFNLNRDLLEKYASKKTLKLYKDIDIMKYLQEHYRTIEDIMLPITEQIDCELEYLGNVIYANKDLKADLYYVQEFKTYNDLTKPYLLLYNLRSGETIRTKIKNGSFFSQNSFKAKSIIKIVSMSSENKSKLVNGKWAKSDEKEEILKDWNVIK